MRQFTKAEWKRINRGLDADPERYGFPIRIYGSVLIGSFNVRKLGSARARSRETWAFLARICSQFDLLAIQEVMDDLGGIRMLMELLGPDFGLIVSDKTGAFPGDLGLGERLAFVYNRLAVRRTEIATDITYDRSKLLATIAAHNDELHGAMQPAANYEKQLTAWEGGERRHKPRRPKVRLPVFLSFIRAPFCVSFEIFGHPGTKPYRFMAVNAHLYFGNFIDDRRQEFEALMSWLIARANEQDKAYYPDFFLLGDLNLDYDRPETDRARVEKQMKTLDGDSAAGVHVNFPFLDPHPGRRNVFRTNARLSETFDQIGLFFRDKRFPTYDRNASMGSQPEGPDYGVFDFVDLFSNALRGRSFSALAKEEKAELLSKFEHKVSDHLPLWLRLPLPR